MLVGHVPDGGRIALPVLGSPLAVFGVEAHISIQNSTNPRWPYAKPRRWGNPCVPGLFHLLWIWRSPDIDVSGPLCV